MFEIENLTMIYDISKSEKEYALKGINLKLPDKGLVGIIGPSGSGKSSLMNCLSTLNRPTRGNIIYNGKELTKLSESMQEKLRRTEFGFVFQKHFLIPYMSAVDNVVFPSTESTKKARKKAEELLMALGIEKKEFKRKPAKLSGGQRQRTAAARAMINDPKVLFADEPTSALDHDNAFRLMEVFKEYSNENLVIVITHDSSILKDADMIIEMWDGSISSVRSGDKI